MQTIFLYILKWALCLTMLYIPFVLLLRKESFATFNRMLLIGIIAISAIAPAITLTLPVEVEIAKTTDSAKSTTAPHSSIATAQAESMNAQHANKRNSNWKNIPTKNTLPLIYFIGAAIALTLRIIEIIKIANNINKGTIFSEKHHRMTIHHHKEDCAPYSWFNHVVISQKDYDECGKEILLHEEGHYNSGHSWDMLLLSVVKSLQWFNPFAYMLANEMKEIHEYEADKYVLKHQGDTKAYLLLLLRKAVGESAFNLANNFRQSSVRKRITMMMRKPSAHTRKGKALTVIPMILLYLIIFAKPEYVYSTVEPNTTGDIEHSPQETHTTTQPRIICTQQSSLPIAAPQRIEIPSKKIKPIDTIPMSNKAIRLMERYEEHATETCYEQIDISKSKAGEKLRSMNVKQCSTRIQFISDKQGNAHSITGKSCNLSITGNSDVNINDCKKEATTAAIEYVKSKKWLPAITNNKYKNTIFDAHIILNTQETKNNATYNSTNTMLVGSTPIN